jgi:hypothetical protein
MRNLAAIRRHQLSTQIFSYLGRPASLEAALPFYPIAATGAKARGAMAALRSAGLSLPKFLLDFKCS